MGSTDTKLSTGLPSLDGVLKGLLPGDNVVWQVDTIDDYLAFVEPYCRSARDTGKKLIYFRFASHPPLLPASAGADIHVLNPEEGFEAFIASIHAVIERAGRGAFYVFDCLSELAGDWYSDQMLGNFFMLTCPYLYDMETVTYFALFRNHHSPHATGPISETTQLLLEVLRHKGTRYVRPIKVQQRYSPTMHMLHEWRPDGFFPLTCSATISEVLTTLESNAVDAEGLDFSDRAVLEARETLKADKGGTGPLEKRVASFNHLARMIVTRDDKMLRLVSRFLTLEDVLDVARRMIGTGLIGGKTVGMLVARAILRRNAQHLASLLEVHDSFYIGSDVFYTFLVRNGVWWVRQQQRNPETFLDGAEQARRRILTGKFPDYIVRHFEAMLDYFGQSPFIVRSSSLLEDNFGNSFAGKYDSVFCANQGPRERRLEDFLAAVRTIYASTMSEAALQYRATRGLLDQDEQMALLVMRVSGALHNRHFYPAVAGVGFSVNPYVWSRDIDPAAGVIRLVFGLGTRAVNRHDDDYTRIVALNDPSKRPESNFEEIREVAQHRVDFLDLEANQLVSGHFVDLIPECADLPLDLFASADRSQEYEGRRRPPPTVLTFDRLLKETDFVAHMREMLSTLHAAYSYPVDIEFTANVFADRTYRINLVQCRPLQVQGAENVALPSLDVRPQDRIIEARGAVVGQSRFRRIHRFVYVVPTLYGLLPLRDRHDVAQALGRINRALAAAGPENTMFLGPGRWGTSSPEMGIPVAFSQVNRAAVLCEIVAMRDDFVPDVSLGTHFLNELVEMDMLYIALFPRQGDNFLDTAFFESSPNQLLRWVPDAAPWETLVRIVEPPPQTPVMMLADSLEQRVVCYLDRSPRDAS